MKEFERRSNARLQEKEMRTSHSKGRRLSCLCSFVPIYIRLSIGLNWWACSMGPPAIRSIAACRRRLRKRESKELGRHFAARANIAPSTVSFSHSLRLDNVITHKRGAPGESFLVSLRLPPSPAVSRRLSPSLLAVFSSRRFALITRIRAREEIK